MIGRSPLAVLQILQVILAVRDIEPDGLLVCSPALSQQLSGQRRPGRGCHLVGRPLRGIGKVSGRLGRPYQSPSPGTPTAIFAVAHGSPRAVKTRYLKSGAEMARWHAVCVNGR